MFTSESVTDGHPDKLCDQISDAIVDRFLRLDPFSKVSAECSVSTGIIFLAVKFASKASVDVANVAREVVRQVGYQHVQFNAENCSVVTSVTEMPETESPDEKELTDEEIERIAARDQATLFGFACRHTDQLMPLPIVLAHQLAQQLSKVRTNGELQYLGPDGKTQVGIEFKNRKPERVHSITLLASFFEDPPHKPQKLRQILREAIIDPVFAGEKYQPDDNTRIAINPDSNFGIGGGPASHSGLTGRKTGIDTYGEFARHSGAALSGKDPSRIDRTGAYMARYAAKNIVAAGLADECEVLLSYATGLSRPVSVEVDSYGTGKIPENDIAESIKAAFDFRPAGIVRALSLRELPQREENGFYQRLAAYGQVGRHDLDLPWERTDECKRLLK
jgi:S-adenosylmethionine synthetase